MDGVREEEASGTIVRVEDGLGEHRRLLVRNPVRSKEETCCEDEITASNIVSRRKYRR